MDLRLEPRPQIGRNRHLLDEGHDRRKTEIMRKDDEPTEELGHGLDHDDGGDTGDLFMMAPQKFLGKGKGFNPDDRFPLLEMGD